MSPIYPLTLLYEGACPICRREVSFLARRDKAQNLRFVDIAGPEFDPQTWGRAHGFARFPDRTQLDARIHAVTAASEIVTGLAVFRLAWRAVGLGWLAAATGLPLLRPLAERAYLAFARNRHRLARPVARPRGRMPAGAASGDACADNCRAWRKGT